jgi:hypothetical protein
MSYASIDPQILDWTRLHALKLFTLQGEREIRCVYVSSASGECFQIWIDPPEAGQVRVYAGCVEGRREDDDAEIWRIPVSGLRAALENAFQTVTSWMVPSKRFPLEMPN